MMMSDLGIPDASSPAHRQSVLVTDLIDLIVGRCIYIGRAFAVSHYNRYPNVNFLHETREHEPIATMALQPSLSPFVIGNISSPHTLEFWCDIVCPFSKSMAQRSVDTSGLLITYTYAWQSRITPLTPFSSPWSPRES